MPATQTLAPDVRTLMTGLAMGESPRWHEDRLWFSDWGAQEIIAVEVSGKSEVLFFFHFASIGYLMGVCSSSLDARDW